MKTDKTKNWIDSWKEQLDEYSVTPPPEVWEELSKELDVVSPFGKEPFGGQPLVLHFCYVLLSGYNSSVRLPT